MPETKVASRHLNTKDFIARAKEADESVTSSVSLQDDDDFVFPLKANTKYVITGDLREVGWQPGYAWCMLLVRLSVKKGSPTIWEKVRNYFTPSVMTTYNNLIEAGYKVTRTPTAGAIAFWQNGDKWQGHTGLVDENGITDKSFVCIEGNTDVRGSRDGGAVADKTRPLDFTKKKKGLNLLGFIEL